MKKLFIPFFAFVFLSCEDEVAPTTLDGQWQLFEVLADPGDGSGTFRPTESNEQINLFTDLTFTSSYSLCRQFSNLPATGSGTYDTTRMVIRPEDCEFEGAQLEYNYEINQDGHLIIYFPCIEPCASKYKKIGAISSE